MVADWLFQNLNLEKNIFSKLNLKKITFSKIEPEKKKKKIPKTELGNLEKNNIFKTGPEKKNIFKSGSEKIFLKNFHHKRKLL